MASVVYSLSKDNIRHTLIYSETVLSIDKSDNLYFTIVKPGFSFNIIFDFDDNGKGLSSTYWEVPEKNTLFYLLHNWDSPPWTEISIPVKLNGHNLQGGFFLKFRNIAKENSQFRQFNLTIWKKEVLNG